MSQQIHKFNLGLSADENGIGKEITETTIEMPVAAEILTFGAAHNGVVILALVDTDAPMVERTFITVGNGVDLPDGVGGLHFRGAVKLPNISVAVFETTSVPAAA